MVQRANICQNSKPASNLSRFVNLCKCSPKVLSIVAILVSDSTPVFKLPEAYFAVVYPILILSIVHSSPSRFLSCRKYSSCP